MNFGCQAKGFKLPTIGNTFSFYVNLFDNLLNVNIQLCQLLTVTTKSAHS